MTPKLRWLAAGLALIIGGGYTIFSFLAWQELTGEEKDLRRGEGIAVVTAVTKTTSNESLEGEAKFGMGKKAKARVHLKSTIEGKEVAGTVDIPYLRVYMPSQEEWAPRTQHEITWVYYPKSDKYVFDTDSATPRTPAKNQLTYTFMSGIFTLVLVMGALTWGRRNEDIY